MHACFVAMYSFPYSLYYGRIQKVFSPFRVAIPSVELHRILLRIRHPRDGWERRARAAGDADIKALSATLQPRRGRHSINQYAVYCSAILPVVWPATPPRVCCSRRDSRYAIVSDRSPPRTGRPARRSSGVPRRCTSSDDSLSQSIGGRAVVITAVIRP